VVKVTSAVGRVEFQMICPALLLLMKLVPYLYPLEMTVVVIDQNGEKKKLDVGDTKSQQCLWCHR